MLKEENLPAMNNSSSPALSSGLPTRSGLQSQYSSSPSSPFHMSPPPFRSPQGYRAARQILPPCPRPRSSASKPNPGILPSFQQRIPNSSSNYNYQNENYGGNFKSNYGGGSGNYKGWISKNNDQSKLSWDPPSKWGRDDRSNTSWDPPSKWGRDDRSNTSWDTSFKRSPPEVSSHNFSTQNNKHPLKFNPNPNPSPYSNDSKISPALAASGLTSMQSQEEPDRDTSSEDASLKPPPSKKTRVFLRCELCDLEFTSQIPYDMHLNGAKHAKKLKSENILKSLQEQGQAVQPQDTSNALRCAVCNVVANSSQQLQMHIEGNRHKQQCRKHQIEPSQYTKLPDTAVQKDNQENGGAGDANQTAPKSGDQSQPPPAKMGKFYCETCQVSLNSENQLQQHMGSKKHQAQLEGKKLPGKKPWWWFKRKNPRQQSNSNADDTNNADNDDSEKKPFVGGGGGGDGDDDDFTFAHQESIQ